MAEAENWSRLSKEKLRGEATAFPDGGILTNHNPASLKASGGGRECRG
jgi:hypothetical protein